MNFKVKIETIIITMVMVLGGAIYFANETSAQGKTYKIGDRGPAGGWIFYDKGSSSDGWRYLEAAPEDQGEAEWGCDNESISGATGTAIGTGKANTAAIIKHCGQSKIAAKVASAYHGGGKSDWFLPSIDELNLIYINLHKKGVGGFADAHYWSSSDEDVDEGYAVYQDFSDGGKGDFASYMALRIRAVRAF